MKGDKSNNDIETEKIIDDLIEIPINNLEKRIKEIKAEINLRKILLDSALSTMEFHRQRFEDHMPLMNYSPSIEFALNKKISLRQELLKAEIKKSEEQISCFRDISKLKEKLQSAQEELSIEIEKKKLIKE